MVKYLSAEWVELGKQAVNKNHEFHKLAENLNLTIVHVVTDVPNKGTIIFWSSFKNGECVEVQLGKKSDADFILTAVYDTWKQIHEGSIEIIQAILEKNLKVEGKPIKGIKIMKLAPLMNKIIAGIDTDFSEEC